MYIITNKAKFKDNYGNIKEQTMYFEGLNGFIGSSWSNEKSKAATFPSYIDDSGKEWTAEDIISELRRRHPVPDEYEIAEV